MKSLAEEIGTSVSNIYRIRKMGTVEVLSTNLKPYKDYSAMAVVNIFNDGKKRPNSLKLHKAKNFINRVVKMVQKKHTGGDNKFDLTSIDEAVNSLILDYPELYPEDARVCTKTIYNYVHRMLIDIKPIDLPRMSGLRGKSHINKDKLALEKGQKGVSIDYRPDIASRAEFGHWEGDLVTGPRDDKRSAFLTLLERKTRAYIMMAIDSKSAQNVLDCINKLHDFFGDDFSKVFKDITFDNGNEFAYWKEMETDPKTGEKRTSVFFAHPYCSYERDSNENCNGLIRRFIKKGTDVNKIDPDVSIKINKAINKKRRKIHGYLSSEKMFINELQKLGTSKSKANFYRII
ncbi:MAG TPA: IS30 family transposase [Methanosphaera sp.]|nr:IS30 family transposase [Methanosphaera sp.]